MPETKRARPTREPHILSDHQWWYEDKGGIRVISQALDDEKQHLATTHVRITWRKLLEAAKRCGR